MTDTPITNQDAHPSRRELDPVRIVANRADLALDQIAAAKAALRLKATEGEAAIDHLVAAIEHLALTVSQILDGLDRASLVVVPRDSDLPGV